MSGEVIARAAEVFADSRDPRFVYAHGAFRAVSAELAFTRLSDREGVTLVLGPPGSGKTTLLTKLLAERAAGDCNLYVVGEPGLGFDDFVARCAQAFGLPSEFESRDACMRSLGAFLLERQRSGGSAVLIIDQADRLSPDFLEGLASFARLSKAGRRLSHVILAARLCDGDEASALEPLAGEVAFRCRLMPLAAPEVMAFLRSRLQELGDLAVEIFDQQAVSRLYQCSEGLPQSLVQLGAASLRLAAEQGAAKVSPDLVEQAWQTFASGRGSQASGGNLPDRATVPLAFSKQGFPADTGWNLPLESDESMVADVLPEVASRGARRRVFPLAWRIIAGSGSLFAVALAAYGMSGQLAGGLSGGQTAELPGLPQSTRQAVLQLDSAIGQGRAPAFGSDLTAASPSGQSRTAETAATPIPPRLGVVPEKSPLSGDRRKGARVEGVRILEFDAVLGGSSDAPPEFNLSAAGFGTGDPPPLPAQRITRAGPGRQPALAPVAPRMTGDNTDGAPKMQEPLPPLGLSVAVSQGLEAEPVTLDVALRDTGHDRPGDLFLVLSGLPAGAGLSAGVELDDGRWRLDPAALPGLALTPPRSFSGKLLLRLEAEAASGGTILAQTDFEVLIRPAAAALSLALPPAKGVEDEALPLSVETNLADRLGTRRSWIEISGLPRGGRLSAGRQQPSGETGTEWLLSPEDLDGLVLLPPPNFAGKLTLRVRMVAVDNAGQELTAEGLLPVRIVPQADTPDLVARAPTGREDEALPLTIKAGLRDLDGSEVLRVLISGLPPGARLSAGRPVEYGAWLLAPGDLEGLEFLPPINFSGAWALEVFAMADEPDGGSAQRRRDLMLVVEPAPLDSAKVDGSHASENTFLQKLIERGDELLASKNLVAARLFYERAASRGDFRALASVGRTYDPLELASLGLLSSGADREKARGWYLRGVNAGDPEAVRLWEALVAGEQSARLERKSPMTALSAPDLLR